MFKLKISGYSDDNISFEGMIDDEYGADNHPGFFAFSDGTVVKANYGKKIDGEKQGIWEVELLNKGSKVVNHVLAPCVDAEADPYSDVLEIEFSEKVKLLTFTEDIPQPVTPAFIVACEIDGLLRSVYGQDLDNGRGDEKEEWLGALAKLLENKLK